MFKRKGQGKKAMLHPDPSGKLWFSHAVKIAGGQGQDDGSGKPPLTSKVPPAPSDVLPDWCRDRNDGRGQALYFDVNGKCTERLRNGQFESTPPIPLWGYPRRLRLEDYIPNWGTPEPEEISAWDGEKHFVDEGQGDVLGDPESLPQASFEPGPTFIIPRRHQFA